MDINTIREKYPQYSDLSDEALVNGLHKKYYSDIPVNDFYNKVGFKSEEAKPPEEVKPVVEPVKSKWADTLGNATLSPISFLTGNEATSREKEATSDVYKSLGALGTSIATSLPETIFSKEKKAVEATAKAPYEALNLLGGQTNILDALRKSYGFKTEEKETRPTTVSEAEKKFAEPIEQAAAQVYVPGSRELGAWGAKQAKEITESMSEETKKQIKESTPTGNIFKGENLSFGTDPTSLGYGIQFLNVMGSQAPILVAAMRGRNPAESIQKAAAMGQRLSTGEGMEDARSHIESLSDAELAKASPEFLSLSKTMGVEKARRIVTDKAMLDAGTAQGVVGRFGGEITGHLLSGKFDDFMLKAIQNKAARIATAGAAGAGEQGLEEMAEGLASDMGINKHVVKEVGANSFANLILGALGGGPVSAVSAAKATTTEQKTEEANKPPQFTRDEKGNLVPVSPVAPPTSPVPPTPTIAGQQQDLFGAGELPNQVDQGILNEKQKQESEIERNIFALQQREQTPEVKRQIAALQAQLPKGPGQTLDTLQEEHSALSRAHTALDTQKATLEQQREAIKSLDTPSLDKKLTITNQIKAIEAQQTQIDTRRAELQEQAKKLAKQITPEETTAQRKLKEVSPIVGNVMSKFGLTPKAPIRNAIKNLDMTVPEDRQTFIDEINKHSIKGAKINMEEVEKYLSYFEEKPSGELNRVDTGAVKPSVPVSGEGTTPTEGFTTPVATGMENNIGTPMGLGAGTETLQNVQPDTLEEPSEPSAVPYPENKKVEPAKPLTRQEMLNTKHEGTNLPLAMYGAGPAGIFKTTPINKPSLFHETSPTNAAELIKEDLLETRITGQLFLTDNRDIAIGQKGKNGVLIEYDGNSVSGREHKKPGTGDIAGREYAANAIGKNAIKSITIQKGSKIQLTPSVLRKLKENFDVTKNNDGSVTYVRKTEGQTVAPNLAPQTTPTELQQAQELFGNEAGKDTTLLRSGFTADDAAKALGIKEKPTPTSEGSTILNNLAAAGDVAPKAKTGWFTKEIDDADNALNKSMLDKVKDFVGFGNFFSFDQGYMNVMRSQFVKLGSEGKIAMKDALDALRRVEITQVLYRGQLATEAINTGKLLYDAVTNRFKVIADPDNMDAIREQLKTLADRVGLSYDNALAAASKGFEANRIQSVYDKMNKAKAEITRIEKKIQAKVDTEQNKKMLKKLKADVDMYEKQTQHMTRQQAIEGMKIYNTVPEVQEVARIWQIMRQRVVDELVRSGVTSDEKAESWLDEMAYVPFFRTIEEQKAAGMHILKKGLGEAMAEYAFEGSMLPVENTIGNMYQWMQWSYSRAISNQHQQVALDQMRAVFPDMIKDGKDPRGNTFSVYRDGVKRDYTVANPLVAQYFMGVGNVIFGNKNIISKWASLFTKGITLVPGFSATQLILKDTYEAMHTSGVENPYGIIMNIFQEMYKTATGTSEARKELISRGQLSTREHAMAASHDADIATKLEVKEAAIHSKIIGMLGKFSALSDNLLRQAVYQQLRNEGISEDEASSRATEIFNYRRTSGSPVMQFLGNYVPFMNAFTVSTQVAMNTISGRGITAQTREKGLSTLAQATVLIGIGNLMYMMMVGDDEEYKRMNRYRRDKSYVIPGTGAVIPLREGLFILDKLAAEYAYNMAMHSDVTDAQMFKDAAKRAVLQQITPPTPGVVSAPLGAALNRDIYSGRDIVNVAQSKLLPEYQMNKDTSEFAKLVGKESGMSPLKVDYFLKTMFGGYMTTMANLSNGFIAEQRGRPLPAKEGANVPLEALGFGSYLSKPGTPNVVPDLYTAAHEVDKLRPTILSLAKTDKEAARKLRDESGEGMGLGKAAMGIEKAFSALNKKEAIIREKKLTDIVDDTESPFYGKPYTPEIKKTMIKEIDADRIKMTPKVMELRKRIYEK